MMKIIARCSLEEAKKYNGKLIIPTEEGKKPINVGLNLEVTGAELKEAIGMVSEFITVNGEFPEVEIPEKMSGKVFRKVTLAECEEEITCPEGVVPLLEVRSDYADMRTLISACEKNKNLRVIGGKLLGIKGINIGRFDVEDKNKKLGIYYDGMYDLFKEVELSDLDNLTEIVKKSVEKLKKTTDDTEKKSKNRKPKKVGSGSKQRRKEAMGTLFATVEEVAF
jgi:hypothetical protein